MHPHSRDGSPAGGSARRLGFLLLYGLLLLVVAELTARVGIAALGG